MAQTSRNNYFVIQPGFFIILSLALLLIPVWWVVGWFVAVFFHEFCHYIALRLCKVPVFCITIGAFGAAIQTDEMTPWQELFSAIAGPLGSLVLLLLLHTFPYVALCALVQSLFNLLPIYPMDGGRVVTCICVGLLGEKRGTLLSKRISLFFLLLLLGIGLFLSFCYRLGVIPVVLTVLILVRTIKIPCKDRKLIVQ